MGETELAIEYYNRAIELDPGDGDTYYNRAEVWLHRSKWEDAHKDLKIARDKGVEIIVAFRNDFKSVEDFEKKNGVKLPQDIADMLTHG